MPSPRATPRYPPAAPGPGERRDAAGPHAWGRGDARAAEAKQAAAGRCSTPGPRVPPWGDRAEEPKPPPARRVAPSTAPRVRVGSAGERQPAVSQQRQELGKGEPEGTSPPQSSPPECSSGPVFIPPPAPNAGSEEQKPAGTPGSFSGGGGAFGGARMSYPAPSSSLALNHRICMKIHIRRWFCSARKAKLLF